MLDTTTTENVLIHTVDNLNKDFSLGTEVMANLELYKWWNLTTSFNFFNYHIKGEILEEDISQVKNTWNMRVNSTFKFNWGTRMQLTGFYAGPSVTAQGDREAFYNVNAAIRQDFMNRRASLTLQVRDVFRSRRFEFTTTGEGLYTHNIFTREPQIVILSFTYRLNNYRQQKRNEEINEIDFDNGME
jgi:hypothetical protein